MPVADDHQQQIDGVEKEIDDLENTHFLIKLVSPLPPKIIRATT
jgi:hypothetical protein